MAMISLCLPRHLRKTPGKTFKTGYILAANKTVKQLKTTNAEMYSAFGP